MLKDWREGMKWIKRKAANIRDNYEKQRQESEKKAEAQRQDTLAELRKLENKAKQERQITTAELKVRSFRKAEKVARKREVEEAEVKLEREIARNVRAKKALRAEKYAGVIKAGKVARGLLSHISGDEEETIKKYKPRHHRKARKSGSGGEIVVSGGRRHIRLS